MPKKSKKEKILADLRRRTRTEQSLTVQMPQLVKEDAVPLFQFQAKKETVSPKTQPTTELVAIKRDLYKTFILATLAIAVEVIIYWFKR